MKSIKLPGFQNPLPIDSIIWVEADSNYARVHCQTGRTQLTALTLKWFEPLIPEFIRVNKSALINPDFVREVIDEGSKQLRLLLVDGTASAVSRRRISETKAKLFHYQQDETKRIWVLNQLATAIYQPV